MSAVSARSFSACHSRSVFQHAFKSGVLPVRVHRTSPRLRSSSDEAGASTKVEDPAVPSTSDVDIAKELNKFTRQTASTFAPRSSTASKNPAVKGSVLYNIFEAQAWITMAVGGLLSFNIIYPTDEPSIARLLGMWAIWMFTVPSLRAKECTPTEKDALNLMFVGMPLMNILLPFVWKSFPFIYSADVLMVLGVYYWKGVWKEVYGLPLGPPGAAASGNGDGSSPQ